MRKKIDDDLTLYFTPLYPKKISKKSSKKYKITLGIGGNIGNVKQRFHQLYLNFKSDRRFDIISTSPLLENPPFGYTKQNNFINAVIVIKSNLSPFQILRAMQRYENRYKRKRSFKDAPRTLDIDIIFFDDKKIDHKDLIVPHPFWKERQSVTIPLGYVI